MTMSRSYMQELLVRISIFINSLDDLESGVIPQDKRKDFYKTNWWIWEGWSQYRFEFTPGLSTDQQVNIEREINLHWEWDNYENDLLLPDKNKSGTFVSMRMLPPGKFNFYFTAEDFTIIANDTDIEEWKLNINSTDFQFINVTENIKQWRKVYTKEYVKTLLWVPRPPPKALVLKERLKTPWDFFNSVFKDYKPDNPKILNDWFEFDWSCCRFFILNCLNRVTDSN